MSRLGVGETEADGYRVVPALGIGADRDLAVFCDEGVMVEEPHRDFAGQIDDLVTARRVCLGPGVADTFLIGQHCSEAQGIGYADTAMAQMALAALEQLGGGRVVKVDRLIVLHVKFDEAQRIVRP